MPLAVLWSCTVTILEDSVSAIKNTHSNGVVQLRSVARVPLRARGCKDAVTHFSTVSRVVWCRNLITCA